MKSETNDSFVNHFDGHFAYLKTLDFKWCLPESMWSAELTSRLTPLLKRTGDSRSSELIL